MPARKIKTVKATDAGSGNAPWNQPQLECKPLDVTVRWLYSRCDMKETALCFRGERFGNCVVIDYPIRVYTMPLRDMDKLPLVERMDAPYPASRAIEMIRRIQEKNGLTWGAHRLVHAAEMGQPLPPAELDVKPSEEKALYCGTFGAEHAEESHAASIQASQGSSERKRPAWSEEADKRQAERTARRKAQAEALALKPARDPNQPKRGTVLATICAELGKEPGEARKLLRAAGMRAPYDDGTAIRKVLQA